MENEQDQPGKISGNNKEHPDEAVQHPEMDTPRGMGGTDISGEDSGASDPDKDDASPPSGSPVSGAEEVYGQPDLNDIEQNQDPEPGVPGSLDSLNTIIMGLIGAGFVF